MGIREKLYAFGEENTTDRLGYRYDEESNQLSE
jgi:hypothetical protein